MTVRRFGHLLRLKPAGPAGATHQAVRVGQNRRVEIPSASTPDRAAQAPPALGELYRALRRSLLATLRRHTGDAQVAEDLLHDVVLKALAAGSDAQKAPRNLAAWLYAVARHAAMDHHRRLRPTEELPQDLQAPVDDPDEQATAALSNCLRPLTEHLPDTYRDTLIAAEFDGLPLAEVARLQGISLAAAKQRTSRGRRLLRERLIACCRVALSAQGQVLDHDRCSPTGCAPTAQGCCASPKKNGLDA